MIGTESGLGASLGVMSTPATEQSTSAPDAAASSTGAALATPHTPPEGAVSVRGGDSQLIPPPMYTPNLKFKVKDTEHEFDDWAKGAITDEATEKKVRDLYEKSYGLDNMKQERQGLRDELAQAQEKLTSTDRAIDTIAEYAKVKDWDSFFESLNIPKNDVLKYALELVQREQMPPEQRKQWEEGRTAQQQAKHYQEQSQQLQSERTQFQVERRESELQTEISRTGVSELAATYNAGMGSPSAFRDFVIRIGQAYASQGNDISAEQAVKEAERQLRAVSPQQGTAAAPKGLTVVTPSSKPVLPNIQGRGTSAIKSQVRSLDDLWAKSKELSSRT